MSSFSETLVNLRKEAGFKTAYGFFHDGGGAPVLKMSYANYMATERGKSLPELGKLPALLHALGLPHGSDRAAPLVGAWLRTAYGDAAYSWMLDPLLKGPAPARAAGPAADGGDAVAAGEGQLAAIAGGPLSFLCYLALANDAGALTAGQLAARLGEDAGETARALKQLARAGVLETRPGEKYRCAWAGSRVLFPKSAAAGAAQKKAAALEDELVRKGAVLFGSNGIVRVDTAQLGEVFKLISLFLDSSRVYARTGRSKRSALMAVDGRVIKLSGLHGS